MTVPNTLLDDLTERILIERRMKALFGVNSISNSSISTGLEGLTPFSAVEPSKPKSESNNRMGAKRKYPSSQVEDNDADSLSLPSLELEDDISELEDDYDSHHEEGSAHTSAADVCDSCEPRASKRRKLNTDSSDLIVVLDMDECLIHFRMQDEKENQVVTSQENSREQPQDANNIISINDENEILLRPGLVDFLKYVTSTFKTHIFTAGTKDYADMILDQLCLLIGNESAFCKRWYRNDCDTIDIMNPTTGFCIESVYVKPLGKVAEWHGRDSKDLRRIVHIDDQPKNFLLNHGNGIRVSEWRGTDPDDQVLENVTKVLERIDSQNFGDVRPHLRGESYLVLRDHLDMMHLFPHRRTKGIGATLL